MYTSYWAGGQPRYCLSGASLAGRAFFGSFLLRLTPRSSSAAKNEHAKSEVLTKRPKFEVDIEWKSFASALKIMGRIKSKVIHSALTPTRAPAPKATPTEHGLKSAKPMNGAPYNNHLKRKFIPIPQPFHPKCRS